MGKKKKPAAGDREKKKHNKSSRPKENTAKAAPLAAQDNASTATAPDLVKPSATEGSLFAPTLPQQTMPTPAPQYAAIHNETLHADDAAADAHSPVTLPPHAAKTDSQRADAGSQGADVDSQGTYADSQRADALPTRAGSAAPKAAKSAPQNRSSKKDSVGGKDRAGDKNAAPAASAPAAASTTQQVADTRALATTVHGTAPIGTPSASALPRISLTLALAGMLLTAATGFWAGSYFAAPSASVNPAANVSSQQGQGAKEFETPPNAAVNAALHSIRVAGQQEGQVGTQNPDGGVPQVQSPTGGNGLAQNMAQTGVDGRVQEAGGGPQNDGTPAVPILAPTIEQRIAQLEAQAKRTPADAGTWAELGNLYFDVDSPAKAIAAYERSLALSPGNPQVLTDLGIMYREDGQFAKALEAFDKAIQTTPPFQNALFNSGVVLYFDLGRKKEARLRWQKLLQLNPKAKAADGTPVKELLRTLK